MFNKKLSNLLFALLITFTMSTAVTNNAQALVGLIFKNRIIKVIGGSTTLVGASTFGTGLLIGVTGSTVDALGYSLLGLILGTYIAGLGIIVLDDKSITDIEFSPISYDNTKFTIEEINQYNSELPLINSIRQTIIAESNDNADTTDAEELWKRYSYALSEGTKKIAGEQSIALMKELDIKIKNQVNK